MLPNNTPWNVKKFIIEKCVANWRNTTLQALGKVEARVLQECAVLVKKHFSRFEVGGLEMNVRYV